MLEPKVFAGKMRSLRYTGKVAIRVLGGDSSEKVSVTHKKEVGKMSVMRLTFCCSLS